MASVVRFSPADSLVQASDRREFAFIERTVLALNQRTGASAAAVFGAAVGARMIIARAVRIGISRLRPRHSQVVDRICGAAFAPKNLDFAFFGHRRPLRGFLLQLTQDSSLPFKRAPRPFVGLDFFGQRDRRRASSWPWTSVECHQSPDHNLACNRLIPDGIIDRVLAGPVNHSGLAVKFVRSNVTNNPLIRLESTNELQR